MTKKFQAANSKSQKGLAPRSSKSEVGQVMLLTVMLLTGVILSTASLAALLILYQIRQTTDVIASTQAIFAADAGLECALYKNLKEGSQGCGEKDKEEPVKLTNGAEFITVTAGNTIKSAGKSRRSARAFEAAF